MMQVVGTSTFGRAIHYVQNVAEDIRDLTTKRLLDLDENSPEKFKGVNASHGETETAIRVISENVLAQDFVSKGRHKNTEDRLHQIGHGIIDHRRDWENIENQREEGKNFLIFS